MNGLRRTTLWALLATVVLATGCATPNRQAQANTAFWAGRVGLQIQSQPPQSLSAAFELQGSADHGELLLLSPVGSTLAQLNWTPQAAELIQGGRHWTSSNLDELTTQLAGTPLPLSALFDWLSGQATTPSGWQVDLSQWMQGRIQAERQSPAPTVQLKLLLDR